MLFKANLVEFFHFNTVNIMNLLTEVKIENNPNYGLVVSSRVVAQGLGKQHKHLL